MENYICINGKKAELTEEQMKALGIELPKPSPFERVMNHANTFYDYYFIGSDGSVCKTYDGGYCNGNGTDDLRYRTANYCTDKEILEQRALHETLNRLLWRYAMTHKADYIPDDKKLWSIVFNQYENKVYSSWTHYHLRFTGEIVFDTEEIAKAAIKEIIEPFMKAHPEFKW